MNSVEEEQEIKIEINLQKISDNLLSEGIYIIAGIIAKEIYENDKSKQ